MKELFTPEAKLRRYLLVESTLSRTQGELGIIPAEAASRIQLVAQFDNLNLARLRTREIETGHSMVPLVEELSLLTGAEYAGFVHWGATTQNIQQTGDVIGLKVAHKYLVSHICAVLGSLADLAEKHAETVMAGRTHWQHAVPITFGLKVAAWSQAFRGSLERLQGCRPRLLTGMFGGPAGTFGVVGESGLELQERVCQALGLSSMTVPTRNAVDQFLEFVSVLSIMSCTTSSLGDEVARLMGTEFAEVSEYLAEGDLGSSAMPQKQNAKVSGQIATLSAQVRAALPLALEGAVQSHEVDGARSKMMDISLESVCVLSSELLALVQKLVVGLHVNSDRMISNLKLTNGLIQSELVMSHLAISLGRTDAYRIVHDAAMNAASMGEDFFSLLLKDEKVGSTINEHDLRNLVTPELHIGLSSKIARHESALARAAIMVATSQDPAVGR